jgi:NDP-sugar pyrophosphorylase family protein
MKVVLTCFQSGEFFGPLTRYRPVALLPLLNLPLLQNQIELCVLNGLKDIHIAVVDHPFVIRSFVGDGARWGASIKIWTFKDSCSGSDTIARLADKLNGPAVLLPVEHCIDMNLEELIAFHQSHDRGLTRVLCESELDANSDSDELSIPPVPFKFPQPVDSGILVADAPDVFAGQSNDMIFQGSWMRIDSSRRLWAANVACLNEHFPVLTGKLTCRKEGDVRFGHHTSIAPTSTVEGPALIGNFAVLKSGVHVGSYSTIGDKSVIEKGAHVRASLIADHAYIGSQTTIENCIVADNHILNIKIGSWVAVSDPFLISNIQEKIVMPWTAQLLGKSVAALLLFLTFPIWIGKGLFRAVRGKPFFDRASVLEFDFSSGAASLVRGTTFEHLIFADSNVFVSRLPGLIDVIRGRLALVGVRPLTEIDESTYSEDWAQQRFDAPTGLFTPVDAEGMNDSMEEEKVIAENLYVTRRSFQEDARVLFKSMRNLICR